ncbi:hypothetical protein ACWGJX_43420 [Streptomyces sp. NPDC054775]
MDLTSNARQLLRLVDQSPKPVAISDFFHTINPSPTGVDGNLPDHKAWAEGQLDLYRDSLTLWQQELVRVVHPADGERPDLVITTDKGRAVLAESFSASLAKATDIPDWRIDAP